MFCMAIVACNMKNSKSVDLSQRDHWKTDIVGNWVCEQTEDKVMDDMVSSHACYQTFYYINADGTMKEIEHRYIKMTHKEVEGLQGDNDIVLSDEDAEIFTGNWRLVNDTLYKEGILSKIQDGEYKAGFVKPRKEMNVTGYSIIKRITKDSLFVEGRGAGLACFVRKE